MAHETLITADPTVPAIRVAREFDAPVDALFGAHADPAIFGNWIGPDRLTNTIDVWDFRTGGAWRFHQDDADGNSYEFFGNFHEVRPNELIVQTFTFVGFPDGVALEKLHFIAVADGRSRLETMSLTDSFEDRDGMLASGMESGIIEGYRKLDSLLTDG
jgi:uncharacterized protein YndB with AHSA1/START domain